MELAAVTVSFRFFPNSHLIAADVEVVDALVQLHDLIDDLLDDNHGLVVTGADRLGHLGVVAEVGELRMLQHKFHVT